MMKNDFKRILNYIKPYRLYIVKAFFYNMLYAFFSLFTLGMIVPFISLLFGMTEPVTVRPAWSFSTDAIIGWLSYYITLFNSNYGVFAALMFISGVFIFCSLLSNLFRFLGFYYLTPVNAGVVKDIRNDLFDKILRLPLSFYTKHKSGDMITRFNADMHEVSTALVRCLVELLIKQPWVILIFIVTLFMINPWLTLLSLLIFPLVSYSTRKINKAIRRKSLQEQTELSALSSMYEETLSGVRIIKGFTSQNYFYDKFSSVNRRFAQYAKKGIRYIELSAPVSEMFAVLSLVFIVWVGGMLLQHNQGITATGLILFIIVFARLIPSVQASVRGYSYIQKGLVSARRIFEIMDSEEKITEKPQAISIKELKHDIVFRHVSFAYEKDPVLRDINLEIRKGETIALVGNSGGGKSTLLNLLLRFYDVNAGEILIDGKDIREYVISDVRTLFGVVTQDVMLFNDTVLNNICFGKTDTEKELVIQAARHANAHEFIMEMPQGYETIIGDRGVKLSGGQRQRLSIARAILRNPSVFLLDEATSSLDSQSEQAVQEALNNLMYRHTSVVIAHRLSTIRNADRIIVLKEGVIVEQGAHEELLSRQGEYYHLINM
ncbi:MAG: ABC transporter ATP-binding protein/permease, partial [Bacteroidales bacterium]|nr:ABC transporter ATP-binding protein/permease [Bacteroidales bacterium]